MDSGFRIPVFCSDRRNGSGFRISFRLIDSFSHLILVRAVIRNSVRTMQYFDFQMQNLTLTLMLVKKLNIQSLEFRISAPKLSKVMLCWI